MHRSWLEVSLGSIAGNFRAVRAVVGQEVAVMPVVKADAYRHGAVAVARSLERAGARWLAVSNVQEGAALRDAGIQTRILVMADFLPGSREAFFDYRLTPALHDLGEIGELERLATRRGQAVAFHLKIDSGMGRLGTRSEAAAVAEAVGGCQTAQFEGLMTHFASSSDYGSSQTDEQTRYFFDLLTASGLRPAYVHLSSTIPIAYGRREAWGNMVRPGHAIYGYISPAKGPAPDRELDVTPALTWKTCVLEVKDIPAGAAVGYGAIYRATKPIRIAVLAAGYADGYPHRLSNKGKVLVQGRVCPVIGAVSMDVTTIDVTGIAGLKPGDPVTLLGGEIDAQQIARTAGTISYAVLCGISSRVARMFVD
jgi:alanine racemase